MGSQRDVITNNAFLAFQRTGHPDDLGQVFDRTVNHLYRVACHLTGDPSVAEDLVQDTFLIAIQKRGAYQESHDVAAWLTGILANEVHRSRRQRRRKADPERLRVLVEPSPQERLDANELQLGLEAALEQLPEHYASALRLHLLDGLTSVEIAERLHRSASTVRTQISRGLQALRAALPASLAGAAALASTPSLTAAGLRDLRNRIVTKAGLTGAAATAAMTSIHGIFSMKKTLLAVAALFVSLGGVAIVVQAVDQGPDPVQPSLTLGSQAASRSQARTSPEPVLSAGSARAELSTSDGDGGFRIHGVVRAGSRLAQGAAVYVRLSPRDSSFHPDTAAVPGEHRDEKVNQPLAQTATDSGGRYALHLPPRAGDYLVDVGFLLNGYERHLREDVAVGHQGRECSAALGRGEFIRGRVVDPEGNGIENMSLLAYTVDADAQFDPGLMVTAGMLDTTLRRLAPRRSRFHESVTTTEADGSFELAGLGPGAYRLFSRSPTWLLEPKPVAVGSRGVVVVARKPSGFRVLVTDARGRPIERGFMRYWLVIAPTVAGGPGKQVGSSVAIVRGIASAAWNPERVSFYQTRREDGSLGFPRRYKLALQADVAGYAPARLELPQPNGMLTRTMRLHMVKQQQVALCLRYKDGSPCVDPVRLEWTSGKLMSGDRRAGPSGSLAATPEQTWNGLLCLAVWPCAVGCAACDRHEHRRTAGADELRRCFVAWSNPSGCGDVPRSRSDRYATGKCSGRRLMVCHVRGCLLGREPQLHDSPWSPHRRAAGEVARNSEREWQEGDP